MAATEPIRSKHHVWELAGYWLKRGSVRNYALIVVLSACKPGTENRPLSYTRNIASPKEKNL